MKYLTINGKRYRIMPHENGRNVDLQLWREHSDNKKAKTGKDGYWAFDSCYNDIPHLAKTLLNRGIEAENVQCLESLIIEWRKAITRIVEGLEVK